MPFGNWNPNLVKRVIKTFPSSAQTALVETDVGQGYLKAMGNFEGPHTLACELVGTQLAEWIGLPTLDYAMMELDDIVEIPFINGSGERIGKADCGPAFITRKESGETWGGNKKQLAKVCNPEDIGKLVVFDTWTLNCDRYSLRPNDPPRKARRNLGNVFLSEEDTSKGEVQLKAIDHTHCFTCGNLLKQDLRNLGTIQNPRLFGKFPEFQDFLNRVHVIHAVSRLQELRESDVRKVVQNIPREWDVSSGVQDALVEFVFRRSKYVSETIEQKIWPQRNLGF